MATHPLLVEAFELYNRLHSLSHGAALHGDKALYERVSTLALKALDRYERRYYTIPHEAGTGAAANGTHRR